MKKLVLGLVFILTLSILALIKVMPKETTTQAITAAFSKKYNKSPDAFIVQTSFDTGLFAKGTVGFKDEAGGGMWFGAKTDRGWELVFDGNGIIDCESANKYNLPIDLAPSCLDTQNENNLIQR